MAKSTRSKTKRSYRKVKREDGVFAATHAARLERLSNKLAAIAQTAKPKPLNDDSEASEGEDAMDQQGWPVFALFGLVDQDEISALDWHPLPLKNRTGDYSDTQGHESVSLQGLSALTWRHLSGTHLLERTGL